MNIVDLPFNRFLGIAPSAREGCVLSLPNDVRYTNHLGGVHACALLALAEATSGEYLIREFPDIGFEAVAVVRHLNAKYRKPAHGAIHSKICGTTQKKEEFLSLLTERGRALLEVKVDVFDEQGAHALVAMIEWFVARKK